MPKEDKKLKPRKATEANALKCAEYCFEDTKTPEGHAKNYFGWFTAEWYEEEWLYGGKNGKKVLDALVENGLLTCNGRNYRLAAK